MPTADWQRGCGRAEGAVMPVRRDAQINAQSQPSNEEWLDLVAQCRF